ncbi:hypothetical protein ACKAV7_014700 [Fusarium commune]
MNCYFGTVNSCLTIIHPKLFAVRTQSLDLGLGVMPDNPITLLLMVCMQIVTQIGHDRAFECNKTIQSDVYDAAKRILGILRGLSPPCIELIQCTILLALVELKHGDNMRAYISIGDAYTLALALGIRPGKYIEAERGLPVSYNEEERRCVYWSLLVLDRLIHIGSNLTHIPLQVAAPTDDDLLPTTNIVWDNKTQTQTRTIQRNPANEVPSVPLGAFQRKCQWARLYTEVLCPQPKFNGAGALQNSLAQLHVFTHALLEAMVLQSNHWGGFHEAIAYSSCLLLLICSRQLQTLNSATTNVEPSNVPISEVILALNFAIQITTNNTMDFNNQLSHRPYLLSVCSPVIPYSIHYCLTTLRDFNHLILDADVHFDNMFGFLLALVRHYGIAAAPMFCKRAVLLGYWVEGADKKKFDVINPSTEEVITSVCEGSEKDIDLAVSAARKAFEGEWKKVTPQQRGVYLHKLADIAEKNLDLLAAVESLLFILRSSAG